MARWEGRGGQASCPPSPRQVPRAVGGWVLLCCLPAGSESRGRRQGAAPLQPGP